MSYLEDKEKRLLFSALSREKKVCEKVDKESCREPYETSLKSIVERLEYKFYYDRFEKEIYNKAIGDFVKCLKEYMENKEQSSYIDELNNGNDTYSAMPIYDYVDDLAEQLKSKTEF